MVICNGVTTIGDLAFRDCDSLTSVIIGDSVTTIGEDAFYACTSLTSVTIPDSVTTIGGRAFYDCGLKSITIPDSVTTIGGSAFNDCYNLESVYCKATTPPIGGNYMFYGNDDDRKIYVPKSSEHKYKIDEYWSDYADDIVSFDFESTTTINYTTTDGQIVDARLPIISNTYSNGIGEITFFSDGIIPIEAFQECANLYTITIPDSVTTIGGYAFRDCDSLTSITIPDSVTMIGDSAFRGCDSLTSVAIGDSVTTIREWTFSDCDSLTSVTIGDSVTTIGDDAFYSCDSLTSITIPDSVTMIGDSAFLNCDNLTSVYCKATTPPSLGGYRVFDYNGSGRKIYVPAASVEAYKTAHKWSVYAYAIVGYDF